MSTKTDTTTPGYLAIIPSLPFTDSDRAAVLRSLATRGPRKGLPLRSPPSAAKDAPAFAAWHGWHAAAHAARWGYLPNDCGVYGMMIHGSHDVFDRVYDVILAAARAAIRK